MTEVDRTIPFIETHHHLWELDRFHYDWLTDPGWPGHTALLGDYKMIRSTIGAPSRFFKEFYGANVIKSVHVEAAYAGPDALEETVWLEEVGKEHGFPQALVVFCDIEADGAEAKLDEHLAASDRVRGVRIRAHPDDPDTAAFRSGYAALGKRGLSYELNASPGKLLSGRDVAKANPDVQVILGHAGFPVQRDAEYFSQWRSEMTALGEAQNVACKVSGFGMADNYWTIESIGRGFSTASMPSDPTGSCSARTGRSTSSTPPTWSRRMPIGRSWPMPGSVGLNRKGCCTGTPNAATGSETSRPPAWRRAT